MARKYAFPSHAFAAAFAWHEANECGRRVRLCKAGGQWFVTVGGAA